MSFGPNNPVVKLCLQGMALEGKQQPREAASVFRQAWNGSTTDLERFLSAYFLARVQERPQDRLEWMQTAVQFASSSDDYAAKTALPVLYARLAENHAGLGDEDSARRFRELAEKAAGAPADPGPFFHGTRADLRVGELLTAGRQSNYQSGLVMNHIYFTAMIDGAGLAAALAQGEGRERVYLVEPTGAFEDDPNVTNKKFPGNLTRSYRSAESLRVIGEITDWAKRTPEELRHWRERLASTQGKIIN